MHLGKRFLHASERLALWHSYFLFILYPLTETQRRWARPRVKRRLAEAAEKFRQEEAMMDLAERAYSCTSAGGKDLLPEQRAVEKRLLRKFRKQKAKTQEARQELQSLWEFLREIRVLSPEWGDGLEEFLQSFPKDRWRRQLYGDLARLFPDRDFPALSR